MSKLGVKLKALILGGFVCAFAQTAQAQTVADVQNVQNASLEITVPYTTLSSSHPAVITLQINEPALLSVSAPTPSGFSDPEGTQRTSALRYNEAEATDGTNLAISSPGTVDVEVEMQVIRPQSYLPNDYRYDVVLTVVAQ